MNSHPFMSIFDNFYLFLWIFYFLCTTGCSLRKGGMHYQHHACCSTCHLLYNWHLQHMCHTLSFHKERPVMKTLCFYMFFYVNVYIYRPSVKNCLLCKKKNLKNTSQFTQINENKVKFEEIIWNYWLKK